MPLPTKPNAERITVRMCTTYYRNHKGGNAWVPSAYLFIGARISRERKRGDQRNALRDWEWSKLIMEPGDRCEREMQGGGRGV